jgi:site-specific DNA-methyltransferase (adenine-specific)
MKIDLRLGDCLEVLKTIPDNSIDSVVTDPPYHLTSIVKRFGKENSAPVNNKDEKEGRNGPYHRAAKGFMGKEWDGGDIAFRTEVWEECLRILKPGGHLLAFSHSRTYHRMGVAIEDAGFEIRDQIMWVYGSGFPKSHNIGKAIDKIEGNDREVLGTKADFSMDGAKRNPNYHREMGEAAKEIQHEYGYKQGWDAPVTKGNSEWEGWGTALKPAHEPIVMARKPLSEKSIAENVLKHGTGGINIDGSRIGFRDEADYKESTQKNQHEDFGTKPMTNNNTYGDWSMVQPKNYEPEGRFPANIIFDEEAGQLLDEQSGKSKTKANKNYKHSNTETESNTFTGRGTYTPREDEGGASRFFYCPKAAKSDRNEGLDDFEEKKSGIGSTYAGNQKTSNISGNPDRQTDPKANHHPTVKPTDLMRYLINLITPPNGTILDPFMGSGSTGKAAVRCGLNFIGIEKEQEYMDIASARIEHEKNKPVQTKLFDANQNTDNQSIPRFNING